MRNILPHGIPNHLALAYDAWAPVGAGGKVPDDQRGAWLEQLSKISIESDYKVAYERWKSSFGKPGDLIVEVELLGRLLVGYGNSSATDVGITVHHTWGTPVIPGSALKGLLAHYVDAVYGPNDPSVAPWEQAQTERSPFQGVTWEGRRILRGPGKVYGALFGAPDAKEDSIAAEHHYPAGARAGLVTFHDALYVPGSESQNKPYAVDVLTVHQKSYYDTTGGSWPNDYDEPNPVGFLTVRPGVRLLLALSGPAEWTALASQLLTDALTEWGVGGKTSAGYGIARIRGKSWKVPEWSGPKSDELEQFLAEVESFRKSMTQRDFLVHVEERWMESLVAMDKRDRVRVIRALEKRVKSPRLKEKRQEILLRLS